MRCCSVTSFGLGDGLEWLERLVKREDCPPVVFLFDAKDPHVRTRALQYGAFSYLHKGDVSKARLADAVRAAAAHRGACNSASDSQRSMGAPFTGIKDHANKSKPSVGMSPRKPYDLVINGYQILEKIGSGGMSAVYLATRTVDGFRAW